MSALASCGVFDDDAVHRYVAGTLPPSEVDAFEIHVLSCPGCAVAAREGLLVRAALQSAAPAAGRMPHRMGAGRLGRLVPLAAAAALVLVLTGRSDPLRSLGGVDRLPVFEPLPVRAEPGVAAREADAGMDAYAAADYRSAIRHLEAAAAAEPSAGTYFFLGASHLALDQPIAAATAFRVALQPAGNAYAAEAHFYLAKAFLRVGQADSALAHLGAISAPVSMRRHAAALADSVVAAQER